MPTRKISRSDAVDRFLSTTATLLCSQTPSKLTLADIAGQAGLGQHYIHRFFGTRIDLLIEVADLLATRASEALRKDIPQNTQTFAQLLERCRSLCALRIHLLQYLASEKVPTARFQDGNREMYTAIAEFFRHSGVPSGRAVSNGVVVLAFIHAEISLLPTFDLDMGELEDLISLLMVA
ncbi:MAG: TetR/AcrR family transcriptional regulator [Actinomycetes bacterium]